MVAKAFRAANALAGKALAGKVLAGLAVVLCLGLAVPFSAHAAPDGELITVHLDQAKLLKLPGGTETIVVGNPAIADVSVQKNGVMVLTGRTAGRTNFIALDSTGAIISESIVSVTVPAAGRLLVQRGQDRTTYDCAPNCLPTPTLGDEEKHFNGSIDQAIKRDQAAGQSASGAIKK